MANKRKKNNSPKSKAPVETGAPGGRTAFVLGCLGVLGLVVLLVPAVPWYADKKMTVDGLDMLLRSGDLPERMLRSLDGVGGGAFVAVMIAVAALQAALGFLWEQVYARFGDRLSDVHMGLGVATLAIALMTMLVMLNMEVVGHTVYGAHAAYLVFAASGLVHLVHLMVLDRAAERTEAAMTGSDWAVWLGGLSLTALVHYTFVCYSLVPKAPDALSTYLRRFR